jgi:hypothetical protein
VQLLPSLFIDKSPLSLRSKRATELVPTHLFDFFPLSSSHTESTFRETELLPMARDDKFGWLRWGKNVETLFSKRDEIAFGFKGFLGTKIEFLQNSLWVHHSSHRYHNQSYEPLHAAAAAV